MAKEKNESQGGRKPRASSGRRRAQEPEEQALSGAAPDAEGRGSDQENELGWAEDIQSEERSSQPAGADRSAAGPGPEEDPEAAADEDEDEDQDT